MFKKEFEIDNLNHSFTFQNEELFALLESGEIVKYNINKKEKLWTSEQIKNSSKIGFINENIYCNTGFETYIIEQYSGKTLKHYEFKIVLTLPNDKLFLCIENDKGVKKLGLFNNEFIKLWEKEIKIGKTIFFNNNIFFNTKYLNDQHISGYNLQTYELLWEINIANYARYKDIRQESQEGLITHIIGVYKDILWIGLSSGNIIGLKTKTGEIIHQIGFKESLIPKFTYQIQEGDYLPFGELMQLDEKDGKIIGLRDKYFILIDLNKNEIKREFFDVGQSMSAHKIISNYSNYAFPLDNQFIYFCDDRQGKIGVFNCEKQETIWSYNLEIKQSGIAQILEMKYARNKLFVLDRNNTLHIFRKESNRELNYYR